MMLAAHAGDPWQDGSALFPLAACLGAGHGAGVGGAGSVSAQGLGCDTVDEETEREEEEGNEQESAFCEQIPLEVLGDPNKQAVAAAWELSEWCLSAAVDSTIARLPALHELAAASATIPSTSAAAAAQLATDGPALRRGTTLAALFSLAAVAVDRWEVAARVGVTSAAPAWLRLVPLAIGLLLQQHEPARGVQVADFSLTFFIPKNSSRPFWG